MDGNEKEKRKEWEGVHSAPLPQSTEKKIRIEGDVWWVGGFCVAPSAEKLKKMKT